MTTPLTPPTHRGHRRAPRLPPRQGRRDTSSWTRPSAPHLPAVVALVDRDQVPHR